MALLDQCNPRLIRVEDSCGCAVTRASISAMKPSDFEAEFWKETGMSRVVANMKEMRATGVPEKTLSDLFLSRMIPVKASPLAPNTRESVIAPFIYMPQESRVNANYWEVESGNAHPAAGVGPIPASAWQLVIKNHSGAFASPLVDLEKYFLVGDYVLVTYKDATNTGRTVHLKIIASANAHVPGGIEKALVSVVPNVSAATWAGYAAGTKAIFQPTHGLAIPLNNSVSNYESWCYQGPAVNTKKLKAFWLQTSRRTHCYNEEYLKALEAPLTGEFFKKFRLVPLAEQKRQQGAQYQRKWYNTLFFGDKISDLQEVETYTSLDPVYDPANPSCLLEYKSNAKGFVTLARECNRVTDFQGGPLSLDLIREDVYTLKRHRSAGGAEVTRIEAWTDRHTAHNILKVFCDYYRDTYGVTDTRYYNANEKLVFDGHILWNFMRFELPEEGVELVVIHDMFFDDYLAAVPTADKSVGRWFMMWDWSDLSIGLAGSKSVPRQTDIYDNLYNCIITPVVNHYQLYSETYTCIMQDPNRHKLYNNFSNACPILTADPCASAVSGA